MKDDVVIVGGGPAGAACAMFLNREGVRPLIVEQEQFPRYHIGESLTGAGGKVLRDLGLEQEMTRRNFPTKQGVKVFGTSGRTTWFVPVTGRDEDWKLFDWHTWQVRRSEFDAMVLNEAVRRGAQVLPGRAIRPLMADDGSIRGVEVKMTDGGVLKIESEVLLDCSGQATWLANLGNVTGPKYLGAYDKQIAFFSQVVETVRDHGSTKDTHKDNTLIFYQQKFHWSWFIPLDNEVVSVGVVVPSAYFLEKRESKRDFLVRELQELNPEMPRRIPKVKLIDDVHVIPNYSYQVKGFCGKGVICIGDAHRFIDPIFSFGVTVAMREAQFVAPLVRRYLEGDNRDASHPFADYQRFCEEGIDVLEDTIDLFWEQPFMFATCVHQRYTEYMTDMFAGRIYERQPSPPLLSFRKMMRRERRYDDDLYSIPIGSRFHPERAPLWEPNAVMESTEEWMGPRSRVGSRLVAVESSQVVVESVGNEDSRRQGGDVSVTPADTIREFIIKELHWDGDRKLLTPDYPLIENHVVDSLGLFTLVTFVEEQFGFPIDDEELVPENFGTIAAITKLIESKGAVSQGPV